ncbi:hypothetical protein K439DRAFT_1619009 [Ramaria rubella]|nr:hypothetical protein K439DRAFT_1619009 [Ramaria rubella]
MRCVGTSTPVDDMKELRDLQSLLPDECHEPLHRDKPFITWAAGMAHWLAFHHTTPSVLVVPVQKPEPNNMVWLQFPLPASKTNWGSVCSLGQDALKNWTTPDPGDTKLGVVD